MKISLKINPLASIVILLVSLSLISAAEATIIRVDFSGTIGSAPTDTGFTGRSATGFIQYDTTLATDANTGTNTQGIFIDAITAASFTLDLSYTVFLGGGANKIVVNNNAAGDSITLSGPVAGPDLVTASSTSIPFAMRLDLGGSASVLASDALPFDFSPITTSRELQISFNGGGKLVSALMDTVSFSVVNTDSVLPEPGTLALFGLGLAGLSFARRKVVA